MISADITDDLGVYLRQSHLDRLARAQVPHAYDGVKTRGGDERAIGVERDAVERPRVPLLRRSAGRAKNAWREAAAEQT